MLDGWTPAVPLPDGLTAETVSTAIGALYEAARPADDRELATLIRLLAEFGQAFGMDVGNCALAAEIYREDLGDLPGPVLIEAFLRLRRGWRWPSIPKPGDIRREAEKLMDGWLSCRQRLETAARMIQRQHREQAARQARRIAAAAASQSGLCA